MRVSQKDRVLQHLQEVGSITSFEAFQQYGCTRLSHVIYTLKKEGYVFEDETLKVKNRFGDNVHFKRYKLMEQVLNVERFVL